jgi:hypothetical protein
MMVTSLKPPATTTPHWWALIVIIHEMVLDNTSGALPYTIKELMDLR